MVGEEKESKINTLNILCTSAEEEEVVSKEKSGQISFLVLKEKKPVFFFRP